MARYRSVSLRYSRPTPSPTTPLITTLSSTGGCLAVWAPDSTAIVTYANGCFVDLQRIPLDDPSAAVTLDLASDIEGFPGWQGIAP